MDPIKAKTYSFIVRIWNEPRSVRDSNDLFRGMVIEVSTNETMYFLSLNKMVEFILEKTKFPELPG